VVTNVLHSLSLMALGRPSLTRAIVDRMYDEQAGLFRSLTLPEDEQMPVLTWAALAPLALPDLPEAIGRRLVEEHLLDPKRFWLPIPPASVSATEPAFSVRDSTLGVRRYWRGPTWINAAWLMWLGLVRLGYLEQAEFLRARIGAAVAEAGLREYYDPYTGRGMGASGFGWSALVLELLEPDPRACSSYLSS
jgi:glycogen debranching enzyme